jgi:hypothetical protein
MIGWDGMDGEGESALDKSKSKGGVGGRSCPGGGGSCLKRVGRLCNRDYYALGCIVIRFSWVQLPLPMLMSTLRSLPLAQTCNLRVTRNLYPVWHQLRRWRTKR